MSAITMTAVSAPQPSFTHAHDTDDRKRQIIALMALATHGFKAAPVLVAIHSSFVSTSFSRSLLLSTASGTLLPLPVIRQPRCPAAAVICMAHR